MVPAFMFHISTFRYLSKNNVIKCIVIRLITYMFVSYYVIILSSGLSVCYNEFSILL